MAEQTAPAGVAEKEFPEIVNILPNRSPFREIGPEEQARIDETRRAYRQNSRSTNAQGTGRPAARNALTL